MPTYCIDVSAHNTLARHRGIGRYIACLANALHDLRDELERDERIVAAWSDARFSHAYFSEQVHTERFTEQLPPQVEQAKHFSRYFRSRRAWVQRAMRRLEPDVVHFAEGPAAVHHGSYRSVVTCHDLIPLLMPSQYLRGQGRWWWSERDVTSHQREIDVKRYRHADRVIAISRTTRDALVDELSVSPKAMAVIHQGIDATLFSSAHGDSAVAAPERFVLYVGANDARKRVELLVRSYGRVFERTGVPLLLAGSWHGQSRELRKVFAAAPRGAVTVTGEVSDAELVHLYRAADVFVLPSVYEGFGLPVLEAMAAGCPVVCTRGGALGEVGGNAARYVAIDDGPGLAETLIDLLGDEHARNRLRSLGLERVEAFGWDRCARATLQVYRWAAGRSQAPTEGEVRA